MERHNLTIKPEGSFRGRILALEPGTLELGVAVLDDGEELSFYGVKSLTRHSQPGRVLERLAARHAPGLVVTRSLAKPSSRLGSVGERLAGTARSIKLEHRELDWEVVKLAVTGSRQATRVAVAKQLCQLFPELVPYRKKPHIFSEAYWLKMFCAVALAFASTRTDKVAPQNI